MSSNQNISEIVALFGGPRKMAKSLGIPVSTVHEWQQRGHIPASRVDEIMDAANKQNMSRVVGVHLMGMDQDYATRIQNIQGGTRQRERLKKERFRKNQLSRDISYWFVSSLIGGGFAVIATVMLFMLFFAPDIFPEWTTSKPKVTAQKLPEINSDIKKAMNQIVEQHSETHSERERLQAFMGALQKRNQELQKEIEDYRNAFAASYPYHDQVLSEQLSQISTEREIASEQIGNLSVGLQSLQSGLSNDNTQSAQMLYGMIKVFGDRFNQFSDQTGLDKVLGSSEIESLAGKVDGTDIKAAGLLLATAQLRGALDRKVPFEEDLETVKMIVGDDPELAAAIDRLKPYAEQGLSSREALNTHLTMVAEDIIRMKYEGHDTSFKNPYLKEIYKAIDIDAVKDIPASEIDNTVDVVNNAQEKLNKGDVIGATNEMLKLRGPTMILAEPFIKRAQGYLEANGLMSKLTNEVGGIVQQSGFKLNSPQQSQTTPY